MAAADSELRQLPFHVLSDNACLDAGHHVVSVHPLDFIHAGDVDGNNCSLLLFLKHQRFSHVSSSKIKEDVPSEGNQDDPMFCCHFY